MGLFSGSTKTTTNEKTDTGPSSFQRPYLDETFGAARGIYNNAKGSDYFNGETFAGMSATARDTLDKLQSFAGGQSLSTATTLSNMGSGLLGNYDKAAGAMDRFTQLAGTDATKSNIAAAGQYADNPYVQSQIDANARDVTRVLTEQQLPSIDRGASASGNINSSRAGIAAGVARRGAEDRIGDISAELRGNAYSQGLGLAQQDRASTLAALDRASQGYSSLGQSGLAAIGQGTDAAYASYDAMNKANAMEQANRQGQNDAAFKQWQGNDTREMDLLARYGSVVGSNQWGQSGTSSGTNTQKSSGSVLSQIMGAASMAGSIYTGFNPHTGMK